MPAILCLGYDLEATAFATSCRGGKRNVHPDLPIWPVCIAARTAVGGVGPATRSCTDLQKVLHGLAKVLLTPMGELVCGMS